MNHSDTFGAKNGIKGLSERGIVVMDEKVDGWIAPFEFPDHVPRLLFHPSSVGMRRAAREVNPTAAHFDKKQHINGLQEQGFDGEKVAGEYLVLVMGHQVTPTGRATSFRGRENTMAFQDVGNRFSAYFVAEFGQLPLDFAIAPIPIFPARRTISCSMSWLVRGRPPTCFRWWVHLRRTNSRCHLKTVSG